MRCPSAVACEYDAATVLKFIAHERLFLARVAIIGWQLAGCLELATPYSTFTFALWSWTLCMCPEPFRGVRLMERVVTSKTETKKIIPAH